MPPCHGRRVGEAEIDDFDDGVPGGHHHILGFQVVVQDLLPVDVGEGVTKLQDDAFGCLSVQRFLFRPFRQRASVHPFQDHAVAQFRRPYPGQVITDSRMLQGMGQFIFMPEDGLMDFIPPEFRFEALEDDNPFAEMSLIQDGMAGWRFIDPFEFILHRHPGKGIPDFLEISRRPHHT